MPEDVEVNTDNLYYFRLFYDVAGVRDMGQHGPSPLVPSEIKAWCEYTGTMLTSFERALLLEMDKVFRKAWHEEHAKVQKAIQDKQRNKPKYE